MPFDNATYTPALTLADLSATLRDRSRWPEGFVWNYEDCERCAIGMAAALMNVTDYDDEPWVRRLFRLPTNSSVAIFLNLGDRHGGRQNVTPEHVAIAIDEYLATNPRQEIIMNESGATAWEIRELARLFDHGDMKLRQGYVDAHGEYKTHSFGNIVTHALIAEALNCLADKREAERKAA